MFIVSPGYDPVTTTGQIASGANLIRFTSGRGSMFSSQLAPTLKLASNTPTFTHLEVDMDINCSLVIDGELCVEQMGERIIRHILRAASAEKTKSELQGLGNQKFVPRHLGIVS